MNKKTFRVVLCIFILLAINNETYGMQLLRRLTGMHFLGNAIAGGYHIVQNIFERVVIQQIPTNQESIARMQVLIDQYSYLPKDVEKSIREMQANPENLGILQKNLQLILGAQLQRGYFPNITSMRMQIIFDGILNIAKRIKDEQVRFDFLNDIFKFKSWGSTSGFCHNYLCLLSAMDAPEACEVVFNNAIKASALINSQEQKIIFFTGILQQADVLSLDEFFLVDQTKRTANRQMAQERQLNMPTLFKLLLGERHKSFQAVLTGFEGMVKALKNPEDQLVLIQKTNMFAFLYYLSFDSNRFGLCVQESKDAFIPLLKLFFRIFKDDTTKQQKLIDYLLKQDKCYDYLVDDMGAFRFSIFTYTCAYAPELSNIIIAKIVRYNNDKTTAEEKIKWLEEFVTSIDLIFLFENESDAVVSNVIKSLLRIVNNSNFDLESKNKCMASMIGKKWLSSKGWLSITQMIVHTGMGFQTLKVLANYIVASKGTEFHLCESYEEFFGANYTTVTFINFAAAVRKILSDEQRIKLCDDVFKQRKLLSFGGATVDLILSISDKNIMLEKAERYFKLCNPEQIKDSSLIRIIEENLNCEQNNIIKLKQLMQYHKFFVAMNQNVKFECLLSPIIKSISFEDIIQVEFDYGENVEVIQIMLPMLRQKVIANKLFTGPSVVELFTQETAQQQIFELNSLGPYFNIALVQELNCNSGKILQSYIGLLFGHEKQTITYCNSIMFKHDQDFNVFMDGAGITTMATLQEYVKVCSCGMDAAKQDEINISSIPLYNFLNSVFKTFDGKKLELQEQFEIIKTELENAKMFMLSQTCPQLLISEFGYKELEKQIQNNESKMQALRKFMMLVLQNQYESMICSKMFITSTNNILIRWQEFQKNEQKRKQKEREEEEEKENNEAQQQTLAKQVYIKKQKQTAQQISQKYQTIQKIDIGTGNYLNQFTCDTSEQRQQNQKIFLQAASLFFFSSVQECFSIDDFRQQVSQYPKVKWGKFIEVFQLALNGKGRCTRDELVAKFNELNPDYKENEFVLDFLTAASANSDCDCAPNKVDFDFISNTMKASYTDKDYRNIIAEYNRLLLVYREGNEFIRRIVNSYEVCGGGPSYACGSYLYQGFTIQLVNYTFAHIGKILEKIQHNQATSNKEKQLIAACLGDMFQGYPHCDSGQKSAAMQCATACREGDREVLIQKATNEQILKDVYLLSVFCLIQENIQFYANGMTPCRESSMAFAFALFKMNGAYGAPVVSAYFTSDATNHLLNYLKQEQIKERFFTKLFETKDKQNIILDALGKHEVPGKITSMFGDASNFYIKFCGLIVTPESLIIKIIDLDFFQEVVQISKSILGDKAKNFSDVEIVLLALCKCGLLNKK